MIEVVISQTVNGYIVKKTIDTRKNCPDPFADGPYSCTFVVDGLEEAVKIVRDLLSGKTVK